MRDRPTALRCSPGSFDEAGDLAKPKVPENLWDRLDKELEKERIRLVAPENTFSVNQVADKMDVTYSVATGIVERWCRENMVELVGKFGSRNEKYYRFKEK